MEEYTYIAIVLTYRNHEDLRECILSMQDKIPSCKIIVVNAFYNEESQEIIRKMALEYACDFISIENKGYSFGNNVGLQYALEHYDFQYVIISNPDVIIRKWMNAIPTYDGIAPMIRAKKDRLQNPMSIYNNRLARRFIYYGFKKKWTILLAGGILLNRISNMFGKLARSGRKEYPIYAAHGSFVLLHKNSVKTLFPVYDERMFLFGEEGVLAWKMKKNNLVMIYMENLEIFHKEDGSMKFSNISLNEELRKANLFFYEEYLIKKEK